MLCQTSTVENYRFRAPQHKPIPHEEGCACVGVRVCVCVCVGVCVWACGCVAVGVDVILVEQGNSCFVTRLETIQKCLRARRLEKYRGSRLIRRIPFASVAKIFATAFSTAAVLAATGYFLKCSLFMASCGGRMHWTAITARFTSTSVCSSASSRSVRHRALKPISRALYIRPRANLLCVYVCMCVSQVSVRVSVELVGSQASSYCLKNSLHSYPSLLHWNNPECL